VAVGFDKLSNGERISGISAVLLFALMFFNWFGVELVNSSNLLFAVSGGGPGKSAWDALEYIPIVLVITIVATLAMVAVRLSNAASEAFVLVNAPIAVLGFVSTVLILFRILHPPIFGIEGAITSQGTVQAPVFLALLAAAGITFGGCLSMRK
jgi:hypothetical protein